MPGEFNYVFKGLIFVYGGDDHMLTTAVTNASPIKSIFPLFCTYAGYAEKLDSLSDQVLQELIIPLRRIGGGRDQNDFSRIRHMLVRVLAPG